MILITAVNYYKNQIRYCAKKHIDILYLDGLYIVLLFCFFLNVLDGKFQDFHKAMACKLASIYMYRSLLKITWRVSSKNCISSQNETCFKFLNFSDKQNNFAVLQFRQTKEKKKFLTNAKNWSKFNSIALHVTKLYWIWSHIDVVCYTII